MLIVAILFILFQSFKVNFALGQVGITWQKTKQHAEYKSYIELRSFIKRQTSGKSVTANDKHCEKCLNMEFFLVRIWALFTLCNSGTTNANKEQRMTMSGNFGQTPFFLNNMVLL